MTTPVHIIDGLSGAQFRACVSSIGQLITAPFSYDLTKFNELAADDTAYNFYTPKTGQQFVITGIIAKADRQVHATTDAIIIVYEADVVDTTTVSKTILQLAMVAGEQIVLTGLNILVTKGKWINGKTTDDDIHMTITGYYVPIIEAQNIIS